MSSFEGKIAVVTGAAQGIGRLTALRLARDGAQLALIDRATEACEQVCEEIIRGGGTAVAITADLEDPKAADNVVAEVISTLSRIDVAVHNVGGTLWTKPFWEYTDDEIQREINRSLWPTLRCCRAVIPIMMQQGNGSIVNIGSVATRGVFRVPYSAAKGGVHAMTVSMAMELAEHNIRVNCVAPGAVSANRVIPRKPEQQSEQEKAWHQEVIAQSLRDSFQGRLGNGEEIAASVAFLASDEASYITGQILWVAGGGIG